MKVDNENMTKLLHGELTYYLRGVGFQIHNELGGGHAEADYENALAATLEADAIPFQRQPLYYVYYRHQQIGEYRPDMTLADGALQVDLKATTTIAPLHKAQLLSYLAVTNAELGLIMNFGAASMQYARLPNFLHQRQRHLVKLPVDKTLIHFELTTQVLDALYAVHFVLGPGFFQQVYRRAARIEFTQIGLNFTYLKELPLRYNGQIIATRPTRLFHIEQKLLVAAVALIQITPAYTEKMRWAMHTTGSHLGLIANFYPSQLDVRFLRVA